MRRGAGGISYLSRTGHAEGTEILITVVRRLMSVNAVVVGSHSARSGHGVLTGDCPRRVELYLLRQSVRVRRGGIALTY